MASRSVFVHRSCVLFAVITAAVGLGIGLAACSGTSTSTKPIETAVSASGGQAVETNAPGDIPDNQAFVRYTGAGFTLSIPEGWTRTDTQSPAGVVFSDKYNRITITSGAMAAAPTVASARTDELPAIAAATQGYKAGSISAVKRSAGDAVLITYKGLSPVNTVTGKVTNQDVERYEFWHAGQELVVTLAAPVGSDNVDPWRKVTDSIRWTS